MAKSEHKNNTNKDSDDGQQEFAFDAASDSKKSRLWIFAALVLIAIAAVSGLYWSQSIHVDSMSVQGADLSNVQDIRRQARFAMGKKRDSVSMLHIIDSVQTVDFVRNANVSINLNGTLELEIIERQPIALLADRSPKMWVDRDGVLLPLRLGRSVNVPLLYGFTEGTKHDTLQSEAFRRVSDFLATARSHDFTWSTLSQVTYHSEQGVIAVSGEESVRLIFGKRDFNRRMSYWKSFYEQVLKHKKQPEHREIDLRYEGQIVTR